MGQIRFRLHDRDRIAPGGLDRIYVAGLEEIPWWTRAVFEGDQLVVERSLCDSGNVYVPWQVDGHGTRVLSTATLMERERPYLLEVELARGLIQRIRTRLFMWEMLGLSASAELKEQLQAATREFSLAATSQDEPAEAVSCGQSGDRSGTHLRRGVGGKLCQASDRRTAAAVASVHPDGGQPGHRNTDGGAPSAAGRRM